MLYKVERTLHACADIAAGIAIVFGAPQIVAWLSGSADNECVEAAAAS